MEELWQKEPFWWKDKMCCTILGVRKAKKIRLCVQRKVLFKKYDVLLLNSRLYAAAQKQTKGNEYIELKTRGAASFINIGWLGGN